MLRYGTKYKEVVFGVVFGLGASLIDAGMHASMAGSDFLTEFFHPSLVMATYRFLFLVLGVSLGGLLWLRNQTERAFRDLSASCAALRSNIEGPSVLLHTSLQQFLMQHTDGLADDATSLIRTAYENSNAVRRALTAISPC
jgi:hypothetical protein